MPYVKRDAADKIVALFAGMQPGVAEWLDDADPAVISFLRQSEIGRNLIAGSQFLGRLTDAEYTAIMNAVANNLNYQRWLYQHVLANNAIDLDATEVKAIKNKLVSTGILTQNRANELFAKI